MDQDLSTCELTEGGSLTVYIGDRGRTFRQGDRIALDAIAAPADRDRPALTWRAVLGEHVQHFSQQQDAAFPAPADEDSQE